MGPPVISFEVPAADIPAERRKAKQETTHGTARATLSYAEQG